jgi:hypothetical protein
MHLHANAFVDNVHIATKVTKSLLNIEVHDLDPSTKQVRGGPYTIGNVDRAVADTLSAAIRRMDERSIDIRRFRDSVHHVDERINRKSGRWGRLQDCGPMTLGAFHAGPPLSVSTTVIDEDTVSGKKNDKKVQGYLARIELTYPNLESYAEVIENVFTSLPWE